MKRFICAALFTLVLMTIGQAQTAITPHMQNAPARKSPLAEYAGAGASRRDGAGDAGTVPAPAFLRPTQ